LDSWFAFLHSVGAAFVLELDMPPYIKFVRQPGGTGRVQRTLDFGTAVFDPVRLAEWQCVTSICEMAEGWSSDHRPYGVRFQRRLRPARRVKDPRNCPVPACLFRDKDFVYEWSEAVRSWNRNRSRGFKALGEFADLTRAYAKDWREERCVEARSTQHKFDLAMLLQIAARLRTPVPLSRISRKLSAYRDFAPYASLR